MSSDPTVPPAPVVVTKPPVAPPAPPPEPPAALVVADPPKLKGAYLYFCLEAAHPGGAGGTRAEVYDTARFFDSDIADGAPFCPGCNRNVSALPVDDDTVLPPSIQLLKDRLEAASRGAR